MGNKKKISLQKQLTKKVQGSFRKTKPILVFDTSTIIELEQDNGSQASDFLYGLHEDGFGLHFPALVFQEIGMHNQYHVVSGKPEVSGKAIEAIKKTNNLFGLSYDFDFEEIEHHYNEPDSQKKSGDLIHRCAGDNLDCHSNPDCVQGCIGGLRYFIHQAINGVFVDGSKKSVQDPISRADRQIVESSYLIAANHYNNGDSRPVRAVSLDGHILRSVFELNRSTLPLNIQLDVKEISARRNK